ncbi:hypothetical protein IE4771_PD00108 (plasmid) [Rhizobium etli bv. mimosae str. IE4771]|uniref:Uncharacterized protein n=1 Tax=Rhizobium etli bv. mimosae str. IE4771 TaxID=1432050 RepID=A0A060I6P4_RHIET|nr:hypothetical protein IE4771_PD00108 [Rhizobium sp. IE4771]
MLAGLLAQQTRTCADKFRSSASLTAPHMASASTSAFAMNGCGLFRRKSPGANAIAITEAAMNERSATRWVVNEGRVSLRLDLSDGCVAID